MIEEPTDAMMLAADRAWRECLGTFYCKAHTSRAKAIRAMWKAMLKESQKPQGEGLDDVEHRPHVCMYCHEVTPRGVPKGTRLHKKDCQMAAYTGTNP